MEQRPSWEINSTRSLWRNFSLFVVTKDSLPCSQEPFTYSNPEPNEPYIVRSILILSSQLANSVAQEPEASSPHSQRPATGLYPKPTGSTLHSPSQSPQDPFWSHSHIYVFVFQEVSFRLAIPPKPCTLSSPLSCVPHVPPTSFSFIWSA
jgi:hypothetical protein